MRQCSVLTGLCTVYVSLGVGDDGEDDPEEGGEESELEFCSRY